MGALEDKRKLLSLVMEELPSEALAKAHLHADCTISEPFDYGPFTITVHELSVEGELLKVVLDAGEDVPVDNPYYFHNPPLSDDMDAQLRRIIGAAVETTARHLGWPS
jgi:hypothetical protein